MVMVMVILMSRTLTWWKRMTPLTPSPTMTATAACSKFAWNFFLLIILHNFFQNYFQKKLIKSFCTKYSKQFEQQMLQVCLEFLLKKSILHNFSQNYLQTNCTKFAHFFSKLFAQQMILVSTAIPALLIKESLQEAFMVWYRYSSCPLLTILDTLL